MNSLLTLNIIHTLGKVTGTKTGAEIADAQNKTGMTSCKHTIQMTAGDMVEALGNDGMAVEKKVVNQSFYRMEALGMLERDGTTKPPTFRLAEPFQNMI